MAASTVVSDVMGKVTFLHKFPTIIKATSDDDTPTPGYLYQEIADLTYVSSSYCKSLLDVLVDRLDKSSHHIKFKVLRVMKFVVENGSEEFHHSLLRRSTGIQLATKFSGPPDPLHGNAPYVAVRTAAKELSEVLFDTERSKNKEPSHNKEATVGRGLGTSRSGGSMEGFGNTGVPVHKQKSLGDTIKEGFRQLTDSFRESPATSTQSGPQSDYRPLGDLESDRGSSSSFSFLSRRQRTSSGAESAARQGEYKPVVVDDREGESPRVQSCQPSNRDVRRVTSAHKQGKPGGGWEDSSGGRGSNASNSDGQHSGGSTDLSERLESVSVEDVSMETKLVEDFATASDCKPTPSRDALAQFVKRCSTLNCEKVTELLGLELQSSSVPVQMRCLCALEAMMREDIASPEHLLGFIPNALKKLQVETTDRLLQAKASKILRQLERTHEEATASKISKAADDSTSNKNKDPIFGILQTDNSNNPQTTGTKGPQSSISNTKDSGHVPSHKDDVLLFNSVDTTPSVSKSSGSLFAGMEVGSAPKLEEPESQPIYQLDRISKHETHEVRNNKSGVIGKGDAQLFDGLLDLSSTDQPTLAPDLDANTQRYFNKNSSSLSKESSDSLLQFDDTETQKLKSPNTEEADHSSNGRALITESRHVTIETRVLSPKLEGTQSSTKPSKPDAIMSRSANFQDLIATTGIAVNGGNAKKAGPGPVGKSSANEPTQTSIVQTQTAAPNLNRDQISTLYPQLAGVALSGSSAVPLKLSQRPPEGNFAFVSPREEGKENSHRPGSFDFVKDAMLASKK
ncbi:AP-4 complex accessory subunit Tepsin-like [Patiria miniata]|uniref:ENTH domain-containing protein n=1 Tax=Patiria miniata TaxID=46514 RepID=A0A914AKN4_PATMI|nr:AP-4 complex accessory subunit Tepsin-like [Patiria miniata]